MASLRGSCWCARITRAKAMRGRRFRSDAAGLPDRDYRDGRDYSAAGGGCAWRVYGDPAGARVSREPRQCAEEDSDLMLQDCLIEITGMDAITLQPAAGAHGEFTGILLVRAYHESKGNARKKILIRSEERRVGNECRLRW